MATATIVGGETVTHSLNSSVQSAAVQQALFALGQGDTAGAVFRNPFSTPIVAPGILDVYNFDANGGSFTLPAGAQGLVLNDKHSNKGASLTGHSGPELLVGNQGNDTINAAGGSGSVIVGNGDNQIYLNTPSTAGGNLLIQHGTGHDSVFMYGGNATIDQLGNGNGHTSVFATGINDSISVAGGHTSVYLTAGNFNDTVEGNAAVTVGNGSHAIHHSVGNDTFTFGNGDDTLVLTGGAATAFGGSNKFSFTGAGGNDSVVAGSGQSSINTGAGNDFLEGRGLFGNATFTGGTGSDTFAFGSSAEGGNWAITDFTQGVDKLHLSGAFQDDSKNSWLNDTVNHVVHSGGNTIIHLDPNTTITLTGNINLTKSDFG